MSISSHTDRASLHGEVLLWLNAASESLRDSAWSAPLQFEGVDLLDVLRWPLFGELLALARGEGLADTSHSLKLPNRERLRMLGYRAKVALGELRSQRRSAPCREVSTVFWPRSLGHVKVHLPIAAALRQLGESCSFVVNDLRTFQAVLGRGEPALFPLGLEPRRLRSARQGARRAARALPAEPGVKLPPFVRSVPEARALQALRGVIQRMLSPGYEMIALADIVLRAIRPKALVVGNDITLEGRAGCLVARRRGVASICPMHGVVAGEPLQGSHRADRVLVYGERSRQSLIELGEDPHRIAVNGAAYLAGRPRQTYETDPRIADFLGLKPGQPWILLATSGPGHSVSLEHHRLVVEHVAELSALMPDVRFVAKLHPKDQVAFYSRAEQAVRGSRLAIVTGKEPRLPHDIFAWLQGCTAMLTGASAAALEALLMEVPVITMDFMNELEGIDFIDAGATLHCRTAQELQQAVQTVVCKPAGRDRLGAQARKFLAESFENLDGSPARVAAEIIRDLPGKGK